MNLSVANIIADLPKVELHLHLDCSLSYEVVSILRPEITLNEYRSRFIAPPKCKDLSELLKHTGSGIELMQTEYELQLVVEDLFKQLKNENVIYAEIRFAPLQHLEKGLKPEEVVEIVSHTINRCIKYTGIKAGVILCTLRHYNEEQSLQTVKLTDKFLINSTLVGIDIAGDEAGHPLKPHIIAFDYARKRDIPFTAHAGEAKGPESVWETLSNFNTSRIGHGVQSILDPELVEHLIKHNIHLEICPTCNVQTDIYDTYCDHPVDSLYKAGVSLSINTDARTLSNITLNDEYLKLIEHFNWKVSDLVDCNLNAVSHAFLSHTEKEEIKNKIKTGSDGLIFPR